MLGKCEKVEVVHFGVVVCLPGAHRYLNEMHISKWPPRLKCYYREIKAMMQQNNLYVFTQPKAWYDSDIHCQVIRIIDNVFGSKT